MARAGSGDYPPLPIGPREALALVVRMMRYRVDVVLGLEDELFGLVQTLYTPGQGEGTRERVRRFRKVTGRIARHLADMEYDAIRVRAYIAATQSDDGGSGRDAGQGEVPYIT